MDRRRRRALRIGIRELKNNPSQALRHVRQGRTVTITIHNRPAALLVPNSADMGEAELLRALASVGKLSWAGGKPRGLERAPRLSEPLIAAAVIEGRR